MEKRKEGEGKDRIGNGMERTKKWREGEDIELVEYRMLGHEINRRWNG